MGEVNARVSRWRSVARKPTEGLTSNDPRFELWKQMVEILDLDFGVARMLAVLQAAGGTTGEIR